MRILLVTNLFRPVVLGGYERGCAEFADALAAEGHDVCVLTTDLTDSPPGVPDPGGLEVYRSLRSYRQLDGSFVNGSVRWRMGVERWNLSALRNLSEAWRPDALMWWNLGGLNESLVEAGRRLGIPACGVVNDYWMDWVRAVDPWARLQDKIPLVAPLADAVLGFPRSVDYGAAAHWIFVSDYVRVQAERRLGPLPRTSIVHSGIDLATFTPRAPEPVWSRKLLFVGRVTENKGIDLAVQAVSQLEGASLTVCGPRDVSFGPELEALIERLGVADRVRFVERTRAEDVAREYATHDVVVFPGRWAEPWGKVPLEAMASGVPVITSATGGSVEYCDDGVNCLVATTSDGIGAAVARLESDPALRARLVESGVATAAQYGTGQANEGRRRVLLSVAGTTA